MVGLNLIQESIGWGLFSRQQGELLVGGRSLSESKTKQRTANKKLINSLSLVDHICCSSQ